MYEVRCCVLDQGDDLIVWFTCTCEEFLEGNWCRHCDRVDEMFDPSTATLYGWVEFDGEPPPDPDDAHAFRDFLLRKGMVETL